MKDYKRLERYSKKELIEKIMVRDKHCDDLKELLAVGLKKHKQLEKENKRLNKEIADLMGERDGLKIAVEKLKEENQTLELWLDNKEKLNKEYRKQLDKREQDDLILYLK